MAESLIGYLYNIETLFLGHKLVMGIYLYDNLKSHIKIIIGVNVMRIRSIGYFPKTSDKSAKPEGGGIHPYYELLYLSCGTFRLEWLDEQYVHTGPCIYLLTPNSPHQLEVISGTIEYFYMELEMDHADDYPSLPQIIQWNLMQGSVDHSSGLAALLFRSLDLLWATVIELNERQPELLEEITVLETSKILRFIQELLNHGASSGKQAAGHEALVESLLRYLETNYKENITLQSLSRLVHLSESYLIRIFKQYKGITPFQYLEQLRMDAAVSYLLNTSFTIQEITQLIGYNSIHYFSRHFKHRYGVSPSQWRNEQRAR
jgi:AraC-like DNA-binding protein